MQKIRKKFLSVFMVLAITVFTFVPFVNVNAGEYIRMQDGSTTYVTAVENLKKESTVYLGEVVVDGTTQVYYIYSSNISNKPYVFENLKDSVNSNYKSLIPTLSEDADNNGLTASSVNLGTIDSNWADARYVAENYYNNGEITSTTNNLYDVDNSFKSFVDESKEERAEGLDTAVPSNKEFVSPINVRTEESFRMEDGNLVKLLDITYDVERTTVIYTKAEVTTSGDPSSNTQVTSANVTLKAPKVGDEITKVTKNDGYGDYDAQSSNPTVSTTTEGIDIYAYWVQGLEDLAETPFYGTFESDKYYYAMIDFEAKEGYEFPATFPDGIKINGVAPDEVFAVYSGKYTHVVVKIKATEENENIEYEILDGDKQTYESGKDLSIRANGNLEDLVMLKVDGKELDSSNYTLKSGSTIATLKSSYLSTLSAGNHTLTFVYPDGSVDATFTIPTSINTTSNPQTGDNILLYAGICLISLIGLAGSTLYLKKREN